MTELKVSDATPNATDSVTTGNDKVGLPVGDLTWHSLTHQPPFYYI